MTVMANVITSESNIIHLSIQAKEQNEILAKDFYKISVHAFRFLAASSLTVVEFKLLEAFVKIASENKYTSELRTHNNSVVFSVSKMQLMKQAGFTKSNYKNAMSALETLSKRTYDIEYTRKQVTKKKVVSSTKISDKNKTLFSHKVKKIGEGAKTRYNVLFTLNELFYSDLDTYFLMIKKDMRNELRTLTESNKRQSEYLYNFLLFLSYQFKVKRDTRQKAIIKMSILNIADALQFSDRTMKRKHVLNAKLKECFSGAKQLGYLNSYKVDRAGLVLLCMNENAFYQTVKNRKKNDTNDA